MIVEGRHVHHWYGGTADRLVLRGIAPSEITLQRNGNHATLVIAESSPGAGDGGSIVLRDNFDEWEHRGVDEIAFDDGTTWARVDLRLMWLAQAPTAGDDVIDGFNTWNEINGFAGNDTINGFSGNDTLTGGLGNDSLVGGNQNDTYVYTRGDGHDVIVEGRHVHHWYGGTADRLVLQGIAPSEITLQRNGNHATLLIAESSPGAGDGGSIVLRHNFEEWENRGVEEIAFNDGTVWTRADLRAIWLAQAPTVGDDSISGFNSHDLVEGGAGNDTLNSGSGNDTLIGGAGADALNGGDGVDTASYAGSIGGVTVNLAIGAASGGDATGDSLSSIESLIGSDHGDNLAGNAGVNRLEGGAGDDTLAGGAGGDQLLGDAGLDTASYAGSTAGVTIDLSAGAASGGYADGDTFTGIENLIGSDHADSLTGDAGANRLEGGAGADTLSGGLGDDSYVFGRGGGVDIVSDAGGTDRILFDAGLTGEDVVGEVVGGVLHIGIKATPGDLRPASQLPDRLVIQNWQSLDQQIEIAEFADGSVLSLAEVLQAGNAKALVEQGQSVRGNLVPVTATMDSYQLVTGPSHGVLSIDVSSGIFTFAADAAYLGMDAFTVQVTSTLGGVTSSETVTVGIEIGDGTPQIASGTAGHDALNGGGGNDVFDGLEGDDVLSGGAGDDSLTGGAGNDLLQGGSGTDELIGGDGIDTTSYIGSSAAVTVDLGTGAASGGHAQGDILIGIENLIGSGHGDSLTGDALNNRLEGGDGADTLSGGAGDDTLVGGLGADLLDGGDGIDTVSYAQATEGLRVYMAVPSINSGAASGDRYVSIENVIGSAFNDAIYGNIAENALYGGDGDDRFFSLYSGDSVYGGAGDDRFYSRSGNTYFDGGDGDDTVVYTAVNTSVVTDLAAGIGSFDNSQHTLTGIESASGGRAGDELLGTTGANTFEGNDGNDSLVGREGNDTLSGGAGDDTLWGGADDDMLWGGSGADLIHGEAGVDTASYAFSSAAVTVDLLAGTAIGGDAQGDTLNHIENLIGSDHADSLTGDAGANRFEGGAGADTLSGGAGDDRYAYALGDGDDAIDNAETAPATADDRLLFGQGLDSDDLWFTQDGDDLLVQILDDQRGSLRIQDWYAAGSTGDAAKLDAFETSAGAVLVEQNVQQLVDAMAGLPAGGGDVVDAYKDQVPASVSTAIAAAWQ